MRGRGSDAQLWCTRRQGGQGSCGLSTGLALPAQSRHKHTISNKTGCIDFTIQGIPPRGTAFDGRRKGATKSSPMSANWQLSSMMSTKILPLRWRCWCRLSPRQWNTLRLLRVCPRGVCWKSTTRWILRPPSTLSRFYPAVWAIPFGIDCTS